MLITWMAYATLVAATVSVAALAIERIVAIWGGARRIVWGVALGVAVIGPVAVAVVTRDSAADVRTITNVDRVTIDGSVFARPVPVRATRAPSVLIQLVPIITRIEGRAPQLWLVISGLLFCLFLRAGWMLRGRRAEWRSTNVDGCEVLVARDVGPAVVGAWRPRIVFPEWALTLGRDERMLMLQHEREHVAARDPLLLIVAGFAVVCLPWNAALWLIVRRLRLAVEIDCDARVLRAVNRPREYGMLLLAVGARHAAPLPYAASLAERKPLLERRIRAMTSTRPTRPMLTSAALAVLAMATTTLAAQAPTPRPFAIEPPLVDLARHAAAPQQVDVVTMPAPQSASISPTPAATRVDSVRERRPGVERSISTAAESVVSGPTKNWRATLADLAPAVAPSALPIAPVGHPAAKGDIPFAVIRDWITRYHPDIVNGQSTTALVTIIVDANDTYVSSTTDATTGNSAGKIPVDSIAQIEVLKGSAAVAIYGNAAANGVIVITTKSGNGAATIAARDTAASDNRAMKQYIDGKEVSTPSDTVRLRINSLPSARPLYVIDGVVVDSPDPIARPSDQLDKLGIRSDGIQAVQVLRASAGQIGPNALSIVVVKLKA